MPAALENGVSPDQVMSRTSPIVGDVALNEAALAWHLKIGLRCGHLPVLCALAGA